MRRMSDCPRLFHRFNCSFDSRRSGSPTLIPQPFSQAWEKGAEGGLRVDLRLEASNLLHDGSLAPIVPNQVDEPRCHASSHTWLAILLQCDVSTRTMIDVSDRFADN